MEGEINLCRGLDQTLYIKPLFEDRIEGEYKICPKPVIGARQYHKIEFGNCISVHVCLQ